MVMDEGYPPYSFLNFVAILGSSEGYLPSSFLNFVAILGRI
jgi:hypothetical protein